MAPLSSIIPADCELLKELMTMNWIAEYIIEPDGLCHWQEGMKITDPSLAKAYHEDSLTQLFVENWAQLGVKVGIC